jgi:cobaltochelatase CobN
VLLERPRIDVTLRVSGLFRDVFPTLAQLFETGAEALSKRDEPIAENPYRDNPQSRVFGPRPGSYGVGIGAIQDDFSEAARQASGEAWLSASEWAIRPSGDIEQDRAGLADRVLGADAFVHAQDLPETDLLVANDYAAHEGGFAAAVAALGGTGPALYHLDVTRPDAPRARALQEEISRVVRARAANPDWVASMQAHGFRGGAEIAATLDHMASFAHLAKAVPDHLFDQYFEATLGQGDVVDFLATENPLALSRMKDLFQRLLEAGLWTTRRNSILAALSEPAMGTLE